MMFMLFPFFPFKYATLCSFLHIRSSTQYIQFILFIHIYLKLIIGSPYSFLPLFMYQQEPTFMFIHCLFYVVLSMSVSKSVRVEDGCVLTFLSASRISKEKKNCNSRSGFPGEIAKVIVAQRQIHTYLQCMSNEHTYKKHNHTYTHGDVAVERRTSQCGSGAQTQTGKAGLAVCLSSTDNFGYVDQKMYQLLYIQLNISTVSYSLTC